jgi:hypothetical protein
MTEKNNKPSLRVGIDDDGRIKCGPVNKAGTKWLKGAEDCTSDVLATIYHYVTNHGGKIIIQSGEQPVFMLSVVDIEPHEIVPMPDNSEKPDGAGVVH